MSLKLNNALLTLLVLVVLTPLRVSGAQQPLMNVEQFTYEGGFRVSTKAFGQTQFHSSQYAYGIFTIDKKRNSMFLIGHPRMSNIAEFALPEIKRTANISAFDIAANIKQGFSQFHNTSRVDTGINNYFRVTGIGTYKEGLIVNYINWYDAGGTETDTTVFIEDRTQLAQSEIQGPYQLDGAAHSSGWITEVPNEWQDKFNASHIFGNHAYSSIISRSSVGPSFFAVDLKTSPFISATSGRIHTKALLDFPLKHLLRKPHYKINNNRDAILYNEDGKNDLWTFVSGAAYGFIVPGTRTYLTIGKSGGHESKIGYKIKRTDGSKCGGMCVKDREDAYAYYWAWDVNDLLEVKNEERLPHQIQPYEYGKWPIPKSLGVTEISYGYFDNEENKLYLSVKDGDNIAKYSRSPIFLVYNYKSP
ncbi:hypothetical protein [Agaribacter marinus]|uniref:Uncharacterized protein n=1 Tax=Agaribacter marinus TaxID=1431249 RepID=A0AA37T342_9ALTE|nr:hypothetical protein [Agaribacter marinus]GLR70930.1 hypothetical protein GCM10007852_18380 [Agaribacter marinus]